MSQPIRSIMKSLLPLLALSAFACLPAQAQIPFAVTINTSGLTGTSGGVAFDFISGDGVEQNNTATITSFSTNGTLAGGGNTLQGAATGNLPGSLILKDTGFTESFRGLTFGSSLSFTVNLTSAQAPPGVDEFSFFLTNPANTGSAISTTDPTGSDSLFVFDFNGSPNGAMTVFSSSTPGVSFTVKPAAAIVPEPSPLQSIVVGLTSLGLAFGWRIRRRSSKAMPH